MRSWKRLLGGATAAAITLGGAPAAGQDEARAEIQVLGSATIEKAAELFRLDVRILEQNDDRLAALEAASAKLDRIRSGVGDLQGLSSYLIASDEVGVTAIRPPGCALDSYSNVQRPRDCDPIEYAAGLSFTLEGTPAAAAGPVIAFLTEAAVESVSLTSFDVEDRAAAEREVKQAALADAMSTAEVLAEAAGVEIARPSVIRYGDAGRMMLGMFGPEEDRIIVTGSRRSAPVALTLEPPPVSFSAEVAVTYEIAE